MHEIESSTKSSGINLSVQVKSQALDRAKQGIGPAIRLIEVNN